MITLSIRVDIGEARIGPGKVALLEAIDAHQSIRAAADALGMSYPRALKLLDALNTAARTPLTQSAHGGAHGGGTCLTPAARRVIDAYRRLCAQAREASAPELSALESLFADEPAGPDINRRL